MPAIIRTRVPSSPVTLPATAVAVPVAMAAADSGRDGWPVMAELRPTVLARSGLERPGRDDPFTTRRSPGRSRTRVGARERRRTR